MPKKKLSSIFGKSWKDKQGVADVPPANVAQQPLIVPAAPAPVSIAPLQPVNGATYFLEPTSDQYQSGEVVKMLHQAGYPRFGVVDFQQDLDGAIQELRAVQAGLMPGQYTGFLFKADGDSTHFHSVILAKNHLGTPYALHFEDSPPNSPVAANSPVEIERLAGTVHFPARQRSNGDCLAFALDPLLHLGQPGYVESLVGIADTAIQRHQQNRSSHKSAVPYVQLAELQPNPNILMSLQSFRELPEGARQWTIQYGSHAGTTLDEFWRRHANQQGRNGYMTAQMQSLQQAVQPPEEQQRRLHALLGPPPSPGAAQSALEASTLGASVDSLPSTPLSSPQPTPPATVVAPTQDAAAGQVGAVQRPPAGPLPAGRAELSAPPTAELPQIDSMPRAAAHPAQSLPDLPSYPNVVPTQRPRPPLRS
ncbi:hypothetical protein [Cupriavidus necator]